MHAEHYKVKLLTQDCCVCRVWQICCLYLRMIRRDLKWKKWDAFNAYNESTSEWLDCWFGKKKVLNLSDNFICSVIKFLFHNSSPFSNLFLVLSELLNFECLACQCRVSTIRGVKWNFGIERFLKYLMPKKATNIPVVYHKDSTLGPFCNRSFNQSKLTSHNPFFHLY